MRGWIMAAAIAVMGTAGSAATMPWSDLLVFGDSLSDSGSLGGTATNGQTWAGQLGATPAIRGGTNFAVGSARAVPNLDLVPDFAAQRVLYGLAQPDLGANPLTVVWFGGNDLLAAAAEPSSAPAVIAGALDAIGTGLASLASSGLTRFILPNLPDLSRIPASVGHSPAEQAAIAQASAAFNNGLSQIGAGLRSQGLGVSIFDTAGIFDSILGNPGAYGFEPAKVTDTCEQGQVSCEGFIFWDDIHPTEATHALIAGGIAAMAQPAPVPLPATIWLLAGGLGAVVALGRRRRMAA